MANASDPLVQELLRERHIATLATLNADGSIHLVAVWYAYHDEKLYIATAAQSAKARNVQARPQASLMIDNRSAAARGVTALGTARLVAGERSRELNQRIHDRYLSAEAIRDPRVGPVFAQWDDITIELTPTRWIAWDMRVSDQQAFGGRLSERPDYFLPLDP